MAKVTIVIEDLENNGTNYSMTCEPEMPLGKGSVYTMAQVAAMRGTVFMKHLIENAQPISKKGNPRLPANPGRKLKVLK